MLRMWLIPFFAALSLAGAPAASSQTTRMWNLTQETIAQFRLAPAGTEQWGKNQCENDRDSTIDFDERLRITGVATGRYDAKITYVGGRVCVAKNLDIVVGQTFVVEEKQLTNCSK